MSTDFRPLPSQATDASAKSVLEWLALAHGRTGADDLEELHQQLLALCAATLPSGQRIKLLDLLFKHVELVVTTGMLSLQAAGLPI